MTIDGLKKYINAKNKIRQLQRSIAKLSATIEKIEEERPVVSDVVAHGRRGKKPLKTTVITGLPDAAYQGSKTELLRQRLELERLLAEMRDTEAAVDAYVASISSAEVCEIITLKYLGDHERTWQEVADLMTADPHYGSYSRDAVRQIVKRYMRG